MTTPVQPLNGNDGDPNSQKSSYQAPELGSSDETWTKLNLVFKAPIFGLELFLAPENLYPGQNIHAAL